MSLNLPFYLPCPGICVSRRTNFFDGVLFLGIWEELHIFYIHTYIYMCVYVLSKEYCK